MKVRNLPYPFLRGQPLKLDLHRLAVLIFFFRGAQYTADCFTNYYTAKLPRLFSPFSNPCASGIVFVQELSSANCL